MNRMDWNRWLAHEGDDLLTWLHAGEETVKRAITGIGAFFRERIPQVVRQVAAWVRDKCIYGGRVATRVARIAGFGVVWLGIVLGPLAIYPCIITGVWFALALTGSWWGLRHRLDTPQRIIITQLKEVRRG